MPVCDGQRDGRTEFSSLYRVCITCSAVKSNERAKDEQVNGLAGKTGERRCPGPTRALASTELGLWPAADTFLIASVCVSGMHSQERE